jgi:hypothetical protein
LFGLAGLCEDEGTGRLRFVPADKGVDTLGCNALGGRCLGLVGGLFGLSLLESARYFLAESSTTFYNLHFRSFYVIYNVYLMYIYLLVYSLGQLTQFSYAVVDALSTAIYYCRLCWHLLQCRVDFEHQIVVAHEFRVPILDRLDEWLQFFDKLPGLPELRWSSIVISSLTSMFKSAL